MKVTIRTTQVFRVERTILRTVYADSETDALELMDDVDVPTYDDPNWNETRTLENEEHELT